MDFLRRAWIFCGEYFCGISYICTMHFFHFEFSLRCIFFHLKSTKYSLSIRHAFHRAIRRAFLRALRRIFTEIVDNAVRCVACFRGLGCFTGFVFKGCVVRLYTHIYTYIHIYIQKCIHTYKQTYIHTYTHTYIHTYIQICMHACIHTCTWPPCM